MILRRVDTTFFKSDLAEKLSISAGDPGTFWLHSNAVLQKGVLTQTGSLTEYAREMCAEVFNPETLVWENPKSRANHFWDCEVMASVAAWELGLRNKRPPAIKKENFSQQVKPQQAPRSAQKMSASERLASALNRRR